MADFETINQLIELKRQLSQLNADIKSLHVSFWEKSLPTIVGALVGGAISILIFALTQRRDKKKEELNQGKEYKLAVRKFYGQLAELSQALIIELGTFNEFLCNSNYYTHIASKEQSPGEKKELYERRERQETLYYEERSKVGAITSKMAGIIYEYYFLNPKSDVMKHYEKLINHKYEVIQQEGFTKEMNHEKLVETRIRQVSYARSEIARTIIVALQPLLKCILDENNLEEKPK